MCLAESLLRIPDNQTCDEIIEEKIGGKKWLEHFNKSPSIFVNATTFGLFLAEQVVDLDKSKEDSWNTFGFSPYQWMHVDLSSIYTTSAIAFKIKANELPKIQAFLFAYTGERRRLQKTLNERNFIDKGNGMYEAYLPLKSLIGYREFGWDALKEIRFKILDGTQFEIGDFQLIEFRGNPKKPTEWKGI